MLRRPRPRARCPAISPLGPSCCNCRRSRSGIRDYDAPPHLDGYRGLLRTRVRVCLVRVRRRAGVDARDRRRCTRTSESRSPTRPFPPRRRSRGRARSVSARNFRVDDARSGTKASSRWTALILSPVPARGRRRLRRASCSTRAELIAGVRRDTARASRIASSDCPEDVEGQSFSFRPKLRRRRWRRGGGASRDSRDAAQERRPVGALDGYSPSPLGEEPCGNRRGRRGSRIAARFPHGGRSPTREAVPAPRLAPVPSWRGLRRVPGLALIEPSRTEPVGAHAGVAGWPPLLMTNESGRLRDCCYRARARTHAHEGVAVRHRCPGNQGRGTARSRRPLLGASGRRLPGRRHV